MPQVKRAVVHSKLLLWTGLSFARGHSRQAVSAFLVSLLLLLFLSFSDFFLLDLTEQAYEILNSQDRRQLHLTLAGVEDQHLHDLRLFFFRAIRRVMAEEGPEALQTLFSSDESLERVAAQDVPEEYVGLFPHAVSSPTYKDILAHLTLTSSASTRDRRPASTAGPIPLSQPSITSIVDTSVSFSEPESEIEDQLLQTSPKVVASKKRRAVPRPVIKSISVKSTAGDVQMEDPVSEAGPSTSRVRSPEI